MVHYCSWKDGLRVVQFASIEQAVLRTVENTLRPELVGRLDEKLVFARLNPDVQREICELEIQRESARLRGGGFDLIVSREAVEFLAREWFHPHFGARSMRKTVERYLQDASNLDIVTEPAQPLRLLIHLQLADFPLHIQRQSREF